MLFLETKVDNGNTKDRHYPGVIAPEKERAG